MLWLVCNFSFERLHDKPTKWHMWPAKTQISLGICPVWSESLLSAWRNNGSLATHRVHSKGSDQIWRMPRLIWVFAGCTGHFADFVMHCCAGAFCQCSVHCMGVDWCVQGTRIVRLGGILVTFELSHDNRNLSVMLFEIPQMSQSTTKPTKWHMYPVKT